MIFRSLTIITLFVLAPVLFGGCEPPSAPIVNAPPVPPAPPPPADPASAETGTEVESSAESPESKEPFAAGRGSQSPAQDSSRSAHREQPPIHLSAGVALPQLLPEGTQMGVSVDYKINGPLKSSRYLLVIESSAGQCELSIKLSPMGGTLQDFLPPSVRPEHKPFRARIDEYPGTANAIQASNTVPLQTSY
jgi:hypothetical protein